MCLFHDRYEPLQVDSRHLLVSSCDCCLPANGYGVCVCVATQLEQKRVNDKAEVIKGL